MSVLVLAVMAVTAVTAAMKQLEGFHRGPLPGYLVRSTLPAMMLVLPTQARISASMRCVMVVVIAELVPVEGRCPIARLQCWWCLRQPGFSVR